MKIEFLGSDKFTEKDRNDSYNLAKTFFPWIEDNNFISPDEVTYELMKKIYPNSVIFVKDGEKLIGHAFILPCNKKIMNKFLSREINEKQMFYLMKKEVNELNFNCIYLASSFILPEYRNKGLATQSLVLAIKKLCKIGNKKNVVLFYESLTEEGDRLSKKIGDQLGFKIKGFKELYNKNI
ncbi:MAG: GNAT family N-acetyltransferase [Parcubacteria group bacterium]|jgi:hypothetical protein